MEEFYWQIRNVHIASVYTSGGLFLLRGLAWNFFAARWARSMPLRYLSWTVDTVLLTAALMLMTIIRQYPIQDGWLTVKLILVFPYVILAHLALRGRRGQVRFLYLAGALLTFGYIYSVARAHHPLGIFA